MAPRPSTGFLILALAVSVLLSACRKEEPQPAIPQPETEQYLQVDTISPQPKLPDPHKRYFPIQDAPRERDTSSPEPQLAEIPDSPTDQDTVTLTKPDSSLTHRFYLREQMLNFDKPITESMERPPVHPDSMTWEDIVGPIAIAETPDWIRVLSYLGQAAGLAAVIYILFFDQK